MFSQFASMPVHFLTKSTGDGSPRTQQAPHTLLLNRTLQHNHTRRPQTQHKTRIRTTREHTFRPFLRHTHGKRPPLPLDLSAKIDRHIHRRQEARRTHPHNHFFCSMEWQPNRAKRPRRKADIHSLLSVVNALTSLPKQTFLNTLLLLLVCCLFQKRKSHARLDWTKRLHIGTKNCFSLCLPLFSLFLISYSRERCSNWTGSERKEGRNSGGRFCF